MNIDVNKVKIIVTIPVENLDDVRNAMARIMEMTKEQQNQVALYLFNNIKTKVIV